MSKADQSQSLIAILPGAEGEWRPCPELMTEAEVIEYLRIKEVSSAKNLHNVVENLKRVHDLPCVHISHKPLYPLKAVREWVEGRAGK